MPETMEQAKARMSKWAADAAKKYPSTPDFDQQDEIVSDGIARAVEAVLAEKELVVQHTDPITAHGSPNKGLPETGQRRKPNAKEVYVNFEAINTDLDRLEAKMKEALLPVFRTIRSDLITSVQKRFKLDIGYVNDLVRIRGTNKLATPFLTSVTDAYEAGGVALERDLPKKVKRLATKPNYKPKDALAYLRAKTDFFVTGVDAFLTQETKKILMHAIDVGEPVRDTVRNLQDLFEPFVGNPNVIRDGEQVKPYRLETITRTNITDAFNRGRIIARERVGDFFVGWEYSAILDMKTTEVCRYLDGYVFRDGDSWLEFLKPPRHFNCRSILVPVMVDTVVAEEDYVTDEVGGYALEISGEGFDEKNPAHCYGDCLSAHFAGISLPAPRTMRQIGSVTAIVPTKQKAFDGKQKELTQPPDKLTTGEIGERIVVALVKETDTNVAIVNVNGSGNNNPLDIISDQSAIEVKTGLVSNSAGAQHWRSTLGEPGPGEAEKQAAMSPEERTAWNRARVLRALERKKAFLETYRQASGKAVEAYTFGVILDTDACVADVYKFSDFHARIGWNSEQAKAAYIGSYKYS